MKVPSIDITRFIKDDLTQHVLQLKKKNITPKLVNILIGETPDQLAYVKMKQKLAKELGIELEFIHLKESPAFLQFANLLKDKSQDPFTHGVIMEQPLPSALQSDTIYNFIPLPKELEGRRKKTEFLPPVGLAVLAILKYIYQNTQITVKLYPDAIKDPAFFKQSLKQKKVVLVGRGARAGQPIAKVLSHFRINFINVNSQTYEPEQYYKDADIIITAVGKRILNASQVKPGATLISLGLHSEKDEPAGDYDEADIKSVAGFYTTTPRGAGQLDALFLFKNLIEAAKLQT